MKNYIKFLSLSYLSAIFFETVANTIGDGILFTQDNWFVFFIIWYGLLYSVLYLIYKKFGLVPASIFFAVLGTVAEIIVFKRSNLIIDPIMYFLMALVPCYLFSKFNKK